MQIFLLQNKRARPRIIDTQVRDSASQIGARSGGTAMGHNSQMPTPPRESFIYLRMIALNCKLDAGRSALLRVFRRGDRCPLAAPRVNL
jgi:hypothetical protein